MIEHSDIQLAAIEKLERLKVGALFMEMGTGKTRTALDLMANRIGVCDLFLWMCPCALKAEIERERVKWHPELHLMVVGIESISASDRIYAETLEAVRTHKTFAVVDESLKIKNISAKRTRRLIGIGELSAYRLILNGTPISQNILDLWAQMEFLSPKILNLNFRDFKSRYADYDIKGKFAGRVIRQRNVPHLVSLIEPYVFDAKLYLDIPKVYERWTYRVNEREYEALKDSIFDEMADPDNPSSIDFYMLISRLQRWYTSQEAKAWRLQRLVDAIEGQVVVFVKYLDSIPKGACSLTGDCDSAQRRQAMEDFRTGKERVLYLTYGLGAYGLNLQNCHNVIFAEHTWDYAQRIQAEARVYRMGQTKTCHFYDLVCENVGLERSILRCIGKKENMADVVKTEINKLKAML